MSSIAFRSRTHRICHWFCACSVLGGQFGVQINMLEPCRTKKSGMPKQRRDNVKSHGRPIRRPPPCNLSLQAAIWASRLQSGPPGYNLNLQGAIWASRLQCVRLVSGTSCHGSIVSSSCGGRPQRRQPVKAPQQGSALPTTACQISMSHDRIR